MSLWDWLGFGRGADQLGVLSPVADSTSLLAADLAAMFGTDTTGGPVDRAAAMALPPVARGRNIICGAVGRIAWEARTGNDRTKKQPSILEQPEGTARARALTFAWTTDALLFHGRAWWIVQARDDARPTRVAWVPDYLLTWDSAEWARVAGQPVPAADVIRIDGPHEGLLNYGQPPLKAARAITTAYGRTAANPVPTTELHQVSGDRMSADDIKTLVTQWAAARNSPNGAIGYTNQAVELRTHGVPAEQLLIQGRRAATLDLAQAMNLPAWAVDAEVSGSSITYSNSPSRTRELLDYTLTPYLDAIAGRLSQDDILPRGTWARPITEQLTSPDFADRMAGYKAAQDAGIYTVEQCQQLEAGTPLERTTP